MPLMNADAPKYLSIYLNDHLGGATGGVELAKRMAGENARSEFAIETQRLAREIGEDRETLKAMMRALDVRPDPVKAPLGWAAEKAGRLKLNGQLRGYSPLSRLVEVEGLLGGVHAKLSLWQCLGDLTDVEPRLDAARLQALQARAEDQLRLLEDMRGRAAARALR